MRIQIKCNEKINPKGVEFSALRLSLITEGIDAISFVEYEFYDNLEKVKFGNFFHKGKSGNGYYTVNFDGFHAGDCIFYRAIVTTDTAKYCSDLYSAENGLIENEIVGQWIENEKFDGRVSEFSKKFFIQEDVLEARLYIVGLGFYSSQINGVLTDSYYFKPLLTDFDDRTDLKNNPNYDADNFSACKKTVCYDTYDVTKLLKNGENELRILLGTGWYCNTDKNFVDPSVSFGTPKLFFELHLHTKNSKTVIKSGADCLVRNTFCKSQMFAGDFEDFTQEGETFENAKLCVAPSGKLVPALCEKDAVIEVIRPINVKKTGDKFLYDFGKNHTGGLRIFVKGNRGDTLKVKHYEVLSKDGTPNVYTCRWLAYLNGKTLVSHIDQQGEYILSGATDEIKPLFHWNCYRYAEIELPKDCEIVSLESLFISTDIEQDGFFKSSSKICNDLYRAFVLTQRDNMHAGVPSDCPHREKLPYTGDGQLLVESTMYTLQAEAFYRKWLKDIIDAQGKNGWVPYTAPNLGGGGGYWWCNALPTIALALYKFTGDKSLLQDSLQPSLALVGYYNSVHSGDYVIRKCCSSWLLGDWLAPDPIASNIPYVNTLAFYSAVSQTIEIARFLSKITIVEEMEELQKKIKNAINEIFFDEEKLCYGNGVQGENILPLVTGIAEGEIKEKLWEKTIAYYRKTGKFDTGIVFTPILLNALTEYGATDVAMSLIEAKGLPSFEYMLQKETTLCEHWSKYWPKTSGKEDGEEEVMTGQDVSHCHPMFGSIVAWLYKYVAGLDLSKAYKGKILFAPQFMDRISEAEAEKMTAKGIASIKYNVSGCLKMQIKVPYGMEGVLRIPVRVCQALYVNNINGEMVKTRRNGDYISAKLFGGEWIACSDVSFGERV